MEKKTSKAVAVIPSKGKKQPKFAVGDYVCNDNTVFIKIEAVIDQPGQDYPVYGMTNPKQTEVIKWETEFEIDQKNMIKKVPDFEPYYKLKAGDVLKIGGENDPGNAYVTILARVGDLVLISETPHHHREVEAITRISEQLAELTGGDIEILGRDEKNSLRKHSSLSHQRKIADKWLTIELLCLHNWNIVNEE